MSTCYSPDGSRAVAADGDETFVCNPNAGSYGSMCCNLGHGDQCTADGLCYNAAFSPATWRGWCTDRSWNAPGCVQACTWQNNNSAPMTQCSDGNWCCDTANTQINTVTVNATCCSGHLGINLAPTVVPPYSPSSSSTGNDALKIGLGVGLGVGIPLIISFVVLAIFAARLSSRHKSARSDQPPANVMTMPLQSTPAPWSGPQPAVYQAIPVYPGSQAQQAPLGQPMYTVFEAPGHENKGASIGPGNGA